MLPLLLLHRIEHMLWGHVALDLLQIRLAREVHARSLRKRTDDMYQPGKLVFSQ
jgi:hypothetical protein